MEFRTIQKRLLNRFKDRNPSALNNLDSLLQASYNSIMETATIIENLTMQRNQIASFLANAIVASNILCRVLARLDDS